MKPAFANIRLASNRNDKIDYFCDVAGIEPRILKDLAEYRAIEPDADWHLEARGESAPWHRFEPRGAK